MQSSNTSSATIYFRLLGYLRPYAGYFVISIIGFMMFAASQPALAKLMGEIVTAIEEKKADARYWIPALLFLIYIGRGIGLYLGNYFMAIVANNVVNKLRTDLFSHMMYLPSRYFDNANSGDVIARVVFNTGMVTGAATDSLKVLFREGLTLIGLLAYAFYLNWQMTLLFLTVIPPVGLVVAYVSKRLRKLSTKAQESLAEITEVTSQAVSNNRNVKMFLGEEHEAERFANASEKNLKHNLKVARTNYASTPVMQMIVVMAMGFVVFLIMHPQFMEVMDTAAYLEYITTISLMPKSVRQLTRINATIQRGVAAADSVFLMLDSDAEANNGNTQIEHLNGGVTVEGLNFRYPDTERRALKDISFKAKAGETIALVGRSGSGKSTLASLLTRFYGFKDGKLKIDGVDIREFDLYDYRQQIALVSQQVNLFNASIAENIAYGRRDASRAEIEAAAEKAYASEFIEELSDGFDEIVGEQGVKLSGGQKQRIAIARALLKDSPILILDEATSALDNESERAIQAALDEFMQGRTTFVIAHRLSTIENADQILVMENGRIIESGDHQSLLAKNGAYARLYEQGFEDKTADSTAKEPN